jgi:hypothetical protein
MRGKKIKLSKKDRIAILEKNYSEALRVIQIRQSEIEFLEHRIKQLQMSNKLLLKVIDS